MRGQRQFEPFKWWLLFFGTWGESVLFEWCNDCDFDYGKGNWEIIKYFALPQDFVGDD